jgi:hypothetical protein
VSREIVRYTAERLRNERGVFHAAYCHRWAPEILRDLNLSYWPPPTLPDVEQTKDKYKVIDDGKTIALSTWYAHSPVWGLNGDGFGMTLNTLVELFSAHLKLFDLKITEPIERFIPKLQWENFEIAQAKLSEDVIKTYRKRVLFCNGPAMSGQTKVADATVNDLLARLAAVHRDVLFLQTEDQTFDLPNIWSTRKIIGPVPGECDLNETAYLGTLCDVIVGRCSGPQSFCYNTDVLFDEKKTLVCLCDDERVARWVYMSNAIKAKILWTPSADSETLYSLITKELV